MTLLEVKNLSVSVGGKKILKGVSLRVRGGEILAIMGPNGSGKTTLAYAIMGHPKYTIDDGVILLDGEDITELGPFERSLKGIFLAFQSPVEVKGIRLLTLINAAKNKRVEERDLTAIKNPRVIAEIQKVARELGLSAEYLQRDLNVGFSGGEKKRAEVLQAIMLDPKVIILDEPDSGLDVDGVKVIAKKIKEMAESGKAVLVITHYARLLKHVTPSKIIVLMNGRIVMEGGPELAELIEEKGYNSIG